MGQTEANSACLGVLNILGPGESGDRELIFWDEVTGEQLDTGMVIAARAEEMAEFRKHGVYKIVRIGECYREAGKGPIGVRWIDINKGDKVNPEYRSRLVAKEIKTDKSQELFAATPPLEALKMLLSKAVTEGVGYQRNQREQGMRIEFIDVRRAYFHAKARRRVFIKLPEGEEQEGYCGELEKSMYGTRMRPRIGNRNTMSFSGISGSLGERGAHVYSTMIRVASLWWRRVTTSPC